MGRTPLGQETGQAVGSALASGLGIQPQPSQGSGSRRALSGMPDGASRSLQAVPPGLDSLDLSVGMRWEPSANVSRLLGAIQDPQYPHQLTEELQAKGRS